MSPADPVSERLSRLRSVIGTSTSLTEEEVTFLCECLGHRVKRLQRAAAECFAELGRKEPLRAAVLRDAVASADFRVRWGAAYALSLLEQFPPAAIATAVELLGSDDRDLRWAAADLIKRASEVEPSAVDRLCRAAVEGGVVQRRMALYSLRDLAVRLPAAIAAAEQALAEADVELRLAGLSALVRISTTPTGVADDVVGLLQDPELRVQRAAAAALGILGCCSPHVVRAIEQALDSPDASVRRAAKRSLERLRPE